MCEQNEINEQFSSYSAAALKLLLSVTHTHNDVSGNIDLLYVLETETISVVGLIMLGMWKEVR